MKKFEINQHLSVVLEDNDKINIYVDGGEFRQCKYLLLQDLTIGEIPRFIDNYSSVDEEAEGLDHSLHAGINIENLSPEEEFWAHCSNLQVWEENNYDTRLLHSNLSFPLLRKLAEVGDKVAQIRFKSEVARTFFQGSLRTVYSLILNGYLRYLNSDELKSIFFESNSNLSVRILDSLEKGDKLKDIALLILKSFSDIGDEVSKRLVHKEFDKYCKEDAFKGMTIKEILFYRSGRNSGYYKYIDNQSLLKMILNEKEAIAALKLNKTLHKLCDLAENIYLQTEYDLTQSSLILKPTLLIREDFEENLIMGISDEFVVGINLTGGEYLINLRNLPDIITQFRHLNFLNLSYNYIRKIPKEIKNLQHLEILNLSHNKIKSIPLEINTLSSLKWLNLSNNFLTQLLESIGDLKSLEHLDLSNNKLTSLPSSMKHLKSLKILSVFNNDLLKIPECIKEMKSLTSLDLRINKIHVIPEFLGGLKKLKILYLDLEHFNRISLKTISKLKKKGVLIDLRAPKFTN